MLLSGCWDVPSQPEIASKSMERAILIFCLGLVVMVVVEVRG